MKKVSKYSRKQEEHLLNNGYRMIICNGENDMYRQAREYQGKGYSVQRAMDNDMGYWEYFIWVRKNIGKREVVVDEKDD